MIAKKQILVVEDEAVIGMDIQKRLINLGYDVPLIFNWQDTIIRLHERIL